MGHSNLPRSIKRITILKLAPRGTVDATPAEPLVVERKRPRKSKGITRVWERMIRTTVKAGARTAEDYLERHDRSNRKKRDGWIRDYAMNMMRANRKGMSKVRITKILFR